MTEYAAYNRQISTESGWDNPFRPDGDLSREADEIVTLIKGGKPITPTPQAAPQLDSEEKKTQAINLQANVSSSLNMNATNSVQRGTLKSLNGSKNKSVPGTGARPGQVEVQRSQPQGPQQAEYVTIKNKPKCKCCIIL